MCVSVYKITWLQTDRHVDVRSATGGGDAG